MKGLRSGWTDSDLVTATYHVTLGVAAMPTLSPPGGTYTSAQTVTMASATTGAMIRFSTDGTEPTLTSPSYAGPFVVTEPSAIRARAYRFGWTPSAASTDSYAFDYGTVAIPTIVPQGGEYATTRIVSVTTSTPGATVRYTTDGAEPTEADAAVPANGQVTVDRALRLRVKAFKTAVTPSVTRTADYWITGAVAAGYDHTLALKADGTLWSWGSGGSGRLGDGFTTQRLSPVVVSGLTDVVAIAAGLGHSLAVTRDGTCWAWGDNTYGQLGIGASPTTQLTPAQVPGLTDVVGVAAGYAHSLALKKDGTVWAWGMSNGGQIGDGNASSSYRTSPVQVLHLTGAVAIAAGHAHSGALKTDGGPYGTVWMWGSSGLQGQLGDGTTSTVQRSPVAVFAGAIAFAAAQDHSVVAASDGAVWAWGTNSDGQLGDGSGQVRTAPVRALSVTGAVQVAAGRDNSYARTADGSIWAWGNGYRAGMYYYNAGGIIKTPARLPAADTANMFVAAGGYHAMAIRRDGSLWGWGANVYGELGLGTTSNIVAAPARVPNFSLVAGDWLTGDQDGDGLPTWRELALGLDPRDPDSNGDGLLDGTAIGAGESATSTDMDGDGVSNATERAMGTDPFRADTDGDGVNDFVDAFPLDASRSQAPMPDPNDTTPPVINLLYPTTAIPIPPI